MATISEERTIKNGCIVERVYNMECVSPPIPSNLQEIDGWGNPQAKFERTKIPALMFERRYKQDE